MGGRKRDNDTESAFTGACGKLDYGTVDDDELVQLADLVESFGIRLYHVGILTLCCIVLICPATANHAIPLLIDRIAEEYRLDHIASATIGSGVLIGSVVGVLIFGWLNDHIGRKHATLVAIFGIGLCEVLHLYLPTEGHHSDGVIYWNGFMSLLGLRMLLGIFFGGVAGYANLMLIELLPSMHRGMVMTLMSAGWSLGTLISLWLVWYMETRNWRSALAAPSFFCVSAAVITMACCPESPRWLFVVGREEEARKILETIIYSPVLMEPESNGGRCMDKVPQNLVITVDSKRSERLNRSRLFELWDKQLVIVLIGAILVQVAVQGASYGSFVWTPTILRDLLNTDVTHYRIFAYSEILTTAASLASAWILDSYGRRKALIGIMSAWILSTWLLAFIPRTYHWVMFAYLLQQVASAGIWPAMMVYCAECFPTQVRGTLGSFCQGCGRFSAVIAPIVIGAVLDGEGSPVFGMQKIEVAVVTITMFLLLGLAGAISIPRETAGAVMMDV